MCIELQVCIRTDKIEKWLDVSSISTFETVLLLKGLQVVGVTPFVDCVPFIDTIVQVSVRVVLKYYHNLCNERQNLFNCRSIPILQRMDVLLVFVTGCWRLTLAFNRLNLNVVCQSITYFVDSHFVEVYLMLILGRQFRVCNVINLELLFWFRTGDTSSLQNCLLSKNERQQVVSVFCCF